MLLVDDVCGLAAIGCENVCFGTVFLQPFLKLLTLLPKRFELSFKIGRFCPRIEDEIDCDE